MKQDALNRDRMLREIHDRTEPWDVIVIGGGATGLGVALDACTRNLDTLLLEKGDFAQATSSRSTKLIHGGVRYLREGDFGLVQDALRERRRLMNNAPHLVRERSFVIPTYRLLERPYYWFGLKVYDQLASRPNVPGSRWLSQESALDRLPGLDSDGLRGGVEYFDGQFDDSRLAIHLARSIENHGGRLLNYFPVVDLETESQGHHTVIARDRESDEQHVFSSRAVINATGTFADHIRGMDDPDCDPGLTFSRGSHVVLPGTVLPGDSALMIPKTEDGRVLFAIPWYDRVLVGTTDVPVDQPQEEPAPTGEEVDYLLDHLNPYLNSLVDRSDVRSAFAGLRPLVSSRSTSETSSISRDHQILVSESGLISVLGGKWTTYRLMAEETIDLLVERLGLPATPCQTRELSIHGAEEHSMDGPMSVFGRDRGPIRRLGEERNKASESLHSDLPYPRAVVTWAVRYEMARTVEDVLARRTRCLVLNAEAAYDVAPEVGSIIARELNYSEDQIDQQINSFRTLARQHQVSPNST